ncbi:MAG TPA: hypothetical protein VHA10_16750 [Hypericibacter adhaerens]|jgi:hypothetical protein|uniref:Uncharacterized protein n=1 Tax=Hypericibacter adhaerens TaxID=2602016 RepID=A0A5J6MW99_9PROT|nr:hypothetical protein [Hypericibacter adhaerens]QEX21387.1 hypothetical protein FRZ61_13120 [Hypericibacter adhaerens]HWA44869.1 hypothetical protein [Hypericibacter adhaerens]
MRRAPRTQTQPASAPAPEAEPSRSEAARPAPRATEGNACAQRSRHALRCLLRLVPPGKRTGSTEPV